MNSEITRRSDSGVARGGQGEPQRLGLLQGEPRWLGMHPKPRGGFAA
ncbi:MAG: hypothetical protein GY696_15805 [Gammaproteobacteria bacterium]|nr:hypothetical protein [Gammaproteobacteria bacterium]